MSTAQPALAPSPPTCGSRVLSAREPARSTSTTQASPPPTADSSSTLLPLPPAPPTASPSARANSSSSRPRATSASGRRDRWVICMLIALRRLIHLLSFASQIAGQPIRMVAYYILTIYMPPPLVATLVLRLVLWIFDFNNPQAELSSRVLK